MKNLEPLALVQYPSTVLRRGQKFRLETWFTNFDFDRFTPEALAAASEELHEEIEITKLAPFSLVVTGPTIFVCSSTAARRIARCVGNVFEKHLFVETIIAKNPGLRSLH